MMINEIEGKFYNDPPIPPEIGETIAILPTKESQEKWNHLVSKNGRHFMLLPDLEWPAQIVSQSEPFYYWSEDWNADDSARFTKALRTELEFLDDDEVYLFWMREHGVRTLWSTFCEYWINFLYEDEGVIVVAPNRDSGLVLSNGKAWSGHRI